MQYQNFLTQTLQGAAKIANEMFGNVSGKLKPDDPVQVLTEADLRIGKFIMGEIEKHYPNHGIIEEEAGGIDKKSEFVWVVDPIDGTANFSQGVPLYGIMIGLLRDSSAYAGGVSLPFFSDTYIAEKGEGAFRNGNKLDITDAAKTNSNIVSFGFNGDRDNPDLTREICRVLAEVMLKFPINNVVNSAFDIAMVAQGKYLGAINMTSKIWDNVAQHIIIEEAGGLYTDLYGAKLDYSDAFNLEKNYTYCAASPAIHKKLQEIIHSVESR